MDTIMTTIATTAQTQSNNPAVMVIQPTEPLNHETSTQFIQQVTQALCRATDTVIVDLLWVTEVDQVGVAALATVTDRAHKLGKTLSLQSLQSATRTVLTAKLNHQHQQALGHWQDAMNTNLEQFLSQAVHWCR